MTGPLPCGWCGRIADITDDGLPICNHCLDERGGWAAHPETLSLQLIAHLDRLHGDVTSCLGWTWEWSPFWPGVGQSQGDPR